MILNDDAAAHDTLPPFTTPQKWILAALGAGSLALAAMSFLGMFQAVRDAMRPWFGLVAWMVPVGTDLGILLTAAFSVFLEAVGMRLWWLRWVTLAFVGLQLGLNVGAAHGDPLGSAGHAVLPLLFITIVEVWQFFIRRRRNLIAKTERERIPWARYTVDWKGTRAIRKRMVLWGINRYSDALDMMQQVLRAEAALKYIYGDAWADEAPADLILSLNTAKYLDEACATVAKMRADHERRRNDGGGQKRAAAGVNGGQEKTPNGPGGGHDGESAKGCCTAHVALAQKRVLPPDDAARVNAEHVAVHGSAIGSDKLGRLFQLGSANARALRDRLRESGAESGGTPASRSGAESGPESGSVGQPGSGDLVGAGAGSGSALAGGGS